VFKSAHLSDRSRVLFQRLWQSIQTKRWQWALGLLSFVLVNGYILYRLAQDWSSVQSLDWIKPNIGLLVLTSVVQFLSLLLSIYSWTYVVRQFGYQIPFWQHFKIYTLSNLARKLPGVGWDILARAYLYQKQGGARVHVISSTVMEIVIFGISATIVALLTMLLPGNRLPLVNPMVLLIVLAVFLVLIPSPLFRWFLRWLNRNHESQPDLRWYHVLNWTILNTITIALGGVTIYLFFLSLGVIDQQALIPIIQCWALVVVAGTLLFWLPVDLGITASIIVLVLSTMVPMGQALILMLALRFWNSLTEIAWGIIGYVLPSK